MSSIQLNDKNNIASVLITQNEGENNKQLQHVSVENTILNGTNIRKETGENELPSHINIEDPILSDIDGQELKENSKLSVSPETTEKNKKLNFNKTSNKFSNKNKALGHVLGLGTVGILGVLLAPFTGGMSLLPGAFVVLFGNASALALYGGSQFFLGNPKPKDEVDKKDDAVDSEIPPSSTDGNPHLPRSLSFKDNEEENGDTEPDVISNVMDYLTEQHANDSVIDFINEDVGELEQADFIKELKEAISLEEPNIFSTGIPVAKTIVHFDNGLKMYVGEIAETDTDYSETTGLPDETHPELATATLVEDIPEPHKYEATSTVEDGDTPVEVVVPPAAETKSPDELKVGWPEVTTNYIKTTEGGVSGRSMVPPAVKPFPMPLPPKPAGGWPEVTTNYIKSTEGGVSGRSMVPPAVKPFPMPLSPKPAEGWPEVTTNYIKSTEGGVSGRSMVPPSVKPFPMPLSPKPAEGWPEVTTNYIKSTEGGVSGRSMVPPTVKPSPMPLSPKPEVSWPKVTTNYIKSSESGVSGRTTVPPTVKSVPVPLSPKPEVNWPKVATNYIKSSEGGVSGRSMVPPTVKSFTPQQSKYDGSQVVIPNYIRSSEGGISGRSMATPTVKSFTPQQSKYDGSQVVIPNYIRSSEGGISGRSMATPTVKLFTPQQSKYDGSQVVTSNYIRSSEGGISGRSMITPTVKPFSTLQFSVSEQSNSEGTSESRKGNKYVENIHITPLDRVKCQKVAEQRNNKHSVAEKDNMNKLSHVFKHGENSFVARTVNRDKLNYIGRNI